MKYKILSLDGGGVWSIIQIKCLQKLFPKCKTGHQILSKFDLVAGNSGGSIVLAALAEDMPLTKITELFKTEQIRKEIFFENSFFSRLLNTLFHVGPRYNAHQKLKALNKILPVVSRKSIFDIPAFINSQGLKSPHFLIPAFDYNRQRATFFRSNNNSNGISSILASNLGIHSSTNNLDVTIAEAAHASSNAPVNYFDAPALLKNCDSSYWDGAAAGYNNPVLAATMEAIINGNAANNIVVFSIGTSSKSFPAYHPDRYFQHDSLKLEIEEKGGLKKDVKKIAKSIIAAPPDAASYIAYTMLNPNHANQSIIEYDQFVRAAPQLQPILKENRWILPNGLSKTQFEKLKDLDLDALKNQDVELIEQFAELWFNNYIPNQPIRMDADLQCLIGQNSFEEVRILVNKHFD